MTTSRARAGVAITLAALLLGSCAPGAGPPDGGTADPGPAVSPTAPGLPDGETAADDAVDGTETDVTTAAFTAGVERLEDQYGAVVGLFALDVASGRVVAHGEDERFAFASTIKALAAAAVLDQSSADELDDLIEIGPEDLVTYSPVTQEHVADGMLLRDVVHAAIRQSDNTAGNLLLERLGGPDGLQAALRAAGDVTTVVSRWEPDLNAFEHGDDRDTTTAQALARTLAWFTVGDGLAADDRDLLVASMREVRTGDDTIRAGTPRGWTVANKTGTGGHGTRNDVAVLWPDDGGGPVVLAVMTRTQDPDGTPQDSLLAEVTELALEALEDRR